MNPRDSPLRDLRHTGNTFAASSGAGLRDLMARMGHDSERAPMIYHHEARGADQVITDAIDTHVQAEQCGDEDDGQVAVLAPVGDGTLMAREINSRYQLGKPSGSAWLRA